MTIQEFQRHIHEKYYSHDQQRGSAATFLWFMEEVGELASALGGTDRVNLEEEFADVLAWLCTLANIEGINLSAAVSRKYLAGKGPAGFK